ncbi:MAG TPA: chlorite dismutase family protein [Levilinea sp.]|nr:chlorite dismutase family protein [Levilinea sp.]
MASQQRQEVRDGLQQNLRDSKIHYDLYQVYPVRASADLLAWFTIPVVDERSPALFFEQTAASFNPFRRYLFPVEIWWGLTRPTGYTRGKSAQEIDALEGQRSTYLIVYPFVKTAEWYKMSRDTRQGMMNEHIRTGHQYPDIKQLLLYSTGLQDQEFIVLYETEDLGRFSSLVTDVLIMAYGGPDSLDDVAPYLLDVRAVVHLVHNYQQKRG